MTIIQHYITGLYIMGLNSLIFIDTLLKRQRFLQTATRDRKKENMQSLKLSEKNAGLDPNSQAQLEGTGGPCK